ncbi:MAG: UDP-2,3-diacylglucosamine diphosphatase [Bacteroidia bacterium]|nr:UDP-2,3-diacylglucosamine diphosphatase [Bacteroidia bacterium]MBP9688123.1 UDP-2,3-diacylglucosamine diphosphatase [Bacteroidia bacterium]
MNIEKRKVKLAVISDVHLGTYGCQAKAVNRYLKSINPEILILNGDIIDIWQFSKRYWPESHMKVIQRIFKMMTTGTKVYYLTGNHDEMLRKFTDFKLGNLELLDKLVLDIDGRKAWIFHGDVFDITMKNSKWLAKLGAVGYDSLIVLNSMVNWVSVKLGREKVSFSKRIKNSVKQAIKFIDDFEETATTIAIQNGYDYVVCGHIHQPTIRNVKNHKGETLYLNSGDWVENLTALEYNDKKWSLYHYKNEFGDNNLNDEDELETNIPDMEKLYQEVIKLVKVEATFN